MQLFGLSVSIFSGSTVSIRALTVLVVAVCLCVGCENRPERPAFNAKRCADGALSTYDIDSDGLLAESELASSPGLEAAAKRMDVDQDGSISRDEIMDRVDYYRSATSAVISGSVRIIYKGRPLTDAEVTFDPEPFLGEEFEPCSGTTDHHGEAYVSRESAEFPGIYLGMYRVRVSKIENGKETIPAKYNTDTMLGFEAATDIPGVSDVLEFRIK